MIVIYHADCVDGFTAAWVAWRKYGDAATYVPARYGDPPPDVHGEDVLVLDFSYPRDAVLEMQKISKSMLVFDHHKSAREELADLPWCTFDMERSGAGIACDELHGGERPLLVDYVEDRDLWKWAKAYSREVNAWISSWKFDFETWNELCRKLEFNQLKTGQDLSGEPIVQGEAILRSQDRYVEHLATSAAPLYIAGFTVPCVNTTHAVSEVLNELAKTAPFAVGWFQRQDGAFVYSLRSVGDFDVSVIAKAYGGGGHKNAAGFTLRRLLPLIAERYLLLSQGPVIQELFERTVTSA